MSMKEFFYKKGICNGIFDIYNRSLVPFLIAIGITIEISRSNGSWLGNATWIEDEFGI